MKLTDRMARFMEWYDDSKYLVILNFEDGTSEMQHCDFEDVIKLRESSNCGLSGILSLRVLTEITI